MSGEDTKPFACTACVQRKVKCDKREPCLACVRSRLPCKYRTSPPPPRRKRKVDNANQTLLERLRSHEAAMRSAGIPFDAFDELRDGTNEQVEGRAEGRAEATESPRGRSLPAGQIQNLDSVPTEALPEDPVEKSTMATHKPRRRRGGVLISEHGGKRYYEHGMVGFLGQDYRQDPINFTTQRDSGDSPHSATHGLQWQSSDMLAASVLPGQSSPQASPQYLRPPAAVVMKYWSTFIDNVHPLTKIIHAPTVHQIMADSTSTAPKKTDALKYSICACAVASLTDSECQKAFGEHQTSLLIAFQTATRYALLDSSFLAIPDTDLLRAQVLLLTSMLHTSDLSSIWMLMGSAMRMAQSQGLHRDSAPFGLSPFEIEMRRRLWWYIVTLDGRLTELMGSESTLPKSMDTLLPSNVNDNDLEPNMTMPPQERIRASEMTFCLMQYAVTQFLLEGYPQPDGCELQQSPRTDRQGQRRSTSDLESLLEEKFLRFCDPVIALQFLTTTIARSSICKIRQTAHHRRPRQDPDIPRPASSERRNITVNLAARTIEYDNLIHSSRSLRRFLWHVHFYFPWGAPIFLLRNLASRTEWDEDMEAAWVQIEELYEHHPEYVDNDQVVHLIVGSLTLKAWAAREAALQSRGVCKQRMPATIAAFQARELAFLSRHSDSRTETMRLANEEVNFADIGGFDTVADSNFEFTDPAFAGFDWSNWVDY